MKKIGMDLGKRQTDVCVLDEQGNVEQRCRIKTRRSALSKLLANKEECEVAIESCRDSGWVHGHIKSLGHSVVVIDTTRARSIGIGLGRRKTDRRDAEALARALYAGVAPRAHVLSTQAQRLRDVLQARQQLVSHRVQIITMLRGQMQATGTQLPSCSTQSFGHMLRASDIPQVQLPHVQSLLKTLGELDVQIQMLEYQLTNLARQHEAFERLCTVPGVKLIVTLTFIATIDDPYRFGNAHQVQAFLGLVPSEHSTGGRRRTGGITRCGNALARRMLVQAALVMLRSKVAQDDPLVVWAKQIEKRRGHKKAAVALARRLAGVLWAMWIDGTEYDPKGLARESFQGMTRRQRLAEAETRQMRTAQMKAQSL